MNVNTKIKINSFPFAMYDKVFRREFNLNNNLKLIHHVLYDITNKYVIIWEQSDFKF